MNEIRLIDANELKERLRKQSLSSNREWLQMDLDLVIDNAPTVEPTFGLFKEMLCGTCQAYMRIEPKRPQGEWIPVSKSNPKRNGFYITTCEDICCRNIRVCGYDAVQKKWSRGGVVAWMPNPEPYED